MSLPKRKKLIDGSSCGSAGDSKNDDGIAHIVKEEETPHSFERLRELPTEMQIKIITKMANLEKMNLLLACPALMNWVGQSWPTQSTSKCPVVVEMHYSEELAKLIYITPNVKLLGNDIDCCIFKGFTGVCEQSVILSDTFEKMGTTIKQLSTDSTDTIFDLVVDFAKACKSEKIDMLFLRNEEHKDLDTFFSCFPSFFEMDSLCIFGPMTSTLDDLIRIFPHFPPLVHFSPIYSDLNEEGLAFMTSSNMAKFLKMLKERKWTADSTEGIALSKLKNWSFGLCGDVFWPPSELNNEIGDYDNFRFTYELMDYDIQNLTVDVHMARCSFMTVVGDQSLRLWIKEKVTVYEPGKDTRTLQLVSSPSHFQPVPLF